MGIDFSKKMVAIAEKMFPGIRFAQGDAQDLPCDDANFDRVLINFGLLHLSHPQQACVEGFRFLKSGGRFAFTVWAGPEENPGAKIVNDAIEAHADLDVELPEGRHIIFTGKSRNAGKCWNNPGLMAERRVFRLV